MSDGYTDVRGARWFDEQAQLALQSEDGRYSMLHFDSQPGQDLVADGLEAVFTGDSDEYADAVAAYMGSSDADVGDLRIGQVERDFGAQSGTFYDAEIELDGEYREVEVTTGVLLASLAGSDVEIGEELLLDEEVLEYSADQAWQHIPPGQRDLEEEFTALDAIEYEPTVTDVDASAYERLSVTGLEEDRVRQQTMMGGVQEMDVAVVSFGYDLEDDVEPQGDPDQEFAWQVHPEASELLYKEFLDQTGQEDRFDDGVLDELSRVDPYSVFAELGGDAELYADVVVSGDDMQAQRLAVDTGEQVVDAPSRLVYHLVPSVNDGFHGNSVQPQQQGQMQRVQGVEDASGGPDLNTTGKGMFQ